MSFDQDHGLRVDFEPYSSGKASPDAKRARINDFGSSAAVQLTAPMSIGERRDVLAGWLDDKARELKTQPCSACEIVKRGSRDEPGLVYDWSHGQRFKPCDSCRGQVPHAHLAKFNTDWLVDVMLNHFGGDISRVPTLDELKALL